MYLSSRPPCANTTSVIAPRYSFSSSPSVSGGRRSAMPVKPRMSENSTVIGAPLAAQPQPRGLARDELGDLGVHVVLERVADLALLALLDDRAIDRAAERAEHDRRQRVDAAEREAAAREQPLRRHQVAERERGGRDRAPARRAASAARLRRAARARPPPPPRPARATTAGGARALLQHVVEHRRLQLDARQRRRRTASAPRRSPSP